VAEDDPFSCFDAETSNNGEPTNDGTANQGLVMMYYYVDYSLDKLATYAVIFARKFQNSEDTDYLIPSNGEKIPVRYMFEKVLITTNEITSET